MKHRRGCFTSKHSEQRGKAVMRVKGRRQIQLVIDKRFIEQATDRFFAAEVSNEYGLKMCW
jgi:hypothetical protein